MSTCPQCGYELVWKSGFYHKNEDNSIQRFKCPKCRIRFIERQSTNRVFDKKGSSVEPFPDRNENILPQVLCMENRAIEKHLGRDLQQKTIKGKIVEYLWYMKKKGRKEITLDQIQRRLNNLMSKGLNLLNPEEIKDFLCKQDNWCDRTKAIEVSIYGGFLKYHKVAWDPPEYKPQKKAITMPTEEELEQLICGSGKRLSVFLLILKETGCRVGEATNLDWTDVDFKRRQVSVTSEKGGNPRILPLSERLIDILQRFPKRSKKIFAATKDAIKSNYYQQRLKLAMKLGNPRLRKIRLHDFRHWKLTEVHHETKNLHYVMQFAGHRDIKSTMLYLHLDNQIYRHGVSKFHVATARTVKEESKLIADGWEFVHENNGIMIYRKRK